MAAPGAPVGFGGNPVASLLTGIAKGNVARQREAQRRKEQAIQQALRKASLENQRQQMEIRGDEWDATQEERERERQEREAQRSALREIYMREHPDMDPDQIDALVEGGIDPTQREASRLSMEGERARLTGTRQDNAIRQRELDRQRRGEQLLADENFQQAFADEIAGAPITQETLQVIRGSHAAHGTDWTVDDVRAAQEVAGGERSGGGSGGGGDPRIDPEVIESVANDLVRAAGGQAAVALENFRATVPDAIAEGRISLQEADAIATELDERSGSLTSEEGGSMADQMRRELEARTGGQEE